MLFDGFKLGIGVEFESNSHSVLFGHLFRGLCIVVVFCSFLVFSSLDAVVGCF